MATGFPHAHRCGSAVVGAGGWRRKGLKQWVGPSLRARPPHVAVVGPVRVCSEWMVAGGRGRAQVRACHTTCDTRVSLAGPHSCGSWVVGARPIQRGPVVGVVFPIPGCRRSLCFARRCARGTHCAAECGVPVVQPSHTAHITPRTVQTHKRTHTHTAARGPVDPCLPIGGRSEGCDPSQWATPAV